MAVSSLAQLEKNVSASFGYVKKDLLMLNDAVSEINDKIQHLSLNHASLLEKLRIVEKRKEKKIKVKSKNVKKKSLVKKAGRELIFYDLKSKKKFKSKNYSYKTRGGKRFAVTDAPSGIKAWRIVSQGKKSADKNTPKRIVKETIEY
jgi:hypothetical protein